MTRAPQFSIRAGLLILGLGAAVVLAGCAAGGSGPVTDYKGEPRGVAAPPSSAGGAAFAVWMQKGQHFAIAMYGSSSCPPVASGYRVVGSNRVKLTLKPPGKGPCTMDYAPHTTVFATPSAIRRSANVTILVPGASSKDTTTIKLPGYAG